MYILSHSMLVVDFQVAPFNSISFFFRIDFLVFFFHLLVSGSIMWKAEYKRVHGEGCGGENLRRDEVTVSSLSHHPTR